jgi:DNA modification methylase
MQMSSPLGQLTSSLIYLYHSNDAMMQSSSVALKEQFRLYAYNNSSTPQTHKQTKLFYEALSTQDRLTALLEGDLDFHGQDSSYASHNFHAFAAKFPPQLPRAFIRGLSFPGDVVLDPMMGSGTTIVEALLEGRQAIGFDLDPLAYLLSRVKSTPIKSEELIKVIELVISEAKAFFIENRRVTRTLQKRFDERTRHFVSFWFLPETQRELMSIVLAIENVVDPNIRQFLELTFSSVVVTKSGGVSMARDLAHGRPHRVATKIPRNALDQFALRARKNCKCIASLNINGKPPTLNQIDARSMPLLDETVNLVITSPPYANAIDYMRAHKFSLVWLGRTVRELSELRATYLGAERIGRVPNSTKLPDLVETTLETLAKLDEKRSAIVRKYFIEMTQVFKEIFRVIRCDSAAVIVVGPSTMRGLNMRTHDCLVEIARTCGFIVIGSKQRALDRNKRMMPARFGAQRGSAIEQRMHEEYVIGLYKGAKK